MDLSTCNSDWRDCMDCFAFSVAILRKATAADRFVKSLLLRFCFICICDLQESSLQCLYFYMQHVCISLWFCKTLTSL